MRVLVPTDLSSNSDNAIAIALDIGAHLYEGITFIHLINNLPKDFERLFDNNVGNEHSEIKEELLIAKKALDSLVKRCSEKGLKTDYIIDGNNKKDTIHCLANEQRYDLIVMSSLFSDGNKNRPLGSCMHEVIRYTSIPVLATKSVMKNKVRNIALLSDFTNEYLTNEGWINDFVIKMQAKLFLCCINTPSMFFDYRTMKSRMNNFKKDFDFETTEVIYNDYQFDTGIKHLSEDLDLDLIIMNTHGKKGMDHIGRGGITEQIVDRLDIPILCLPLLDPQQAVKP